MVGVTDIDRAFVEALEAKMEQDLNFKRGSLRGHHIRFKQVHWADELEMDWRVPYQTRQITLEMVAFPDLSMPPSRGRPPRDYDFEADAEEIIEPAQIEGPRKELPSGT